MRPTPHKAPRSAGNLYFMAGTISPSLNDLEVQPEAEKRASRRAIFSRLDGGKGSIHDKKKRKRKVAEYGDTSAAYWKLYGSEAEIHDQKLVDSLSGDTNSMLILNGLFSSVVASFIIEIYKTLQPNNNQLTVNTQSPSSSSQKPNPQQSSPSSLAVRMNILMFLSLFFSLMSVLASVLIQQWCREFMKYAYPRAPPHKRGRVRTYLYQGLDQFQLRRFMYGVHVLLHVSVFLFFWALSDFFHSVDATVGTVARSCLLALVVVYTALSISPLIISNSPYHTALTPPLRSGGMVLLFFYRFIWRSLRGVPIFPLTRREHFKGLRFDRTRFMLEAADARATQLDPYAMKWLFTDNDFSDIDMDKFLEGLPGYIQSHFTDTNHLPKVLTEEYILKRIREHFMSCATSLELSEEACTTRVLACVSSLRTIFRASTKQTLSKHDEALQKKYIQGVVDGLNDLCNEEDPKVSLRASCVRSLAFQGLLTQLTESEGELWPPTRRFPAHLVPLYTFFSSRGNTPGTPQNDNLNPPQEATPEQSPTADDPELWRALLYDGPLVNLTLLAETVVSHDVVGPSKLSLCWKTLDRLLKGLRVVRAKVSDSALARFNDVHHEARERIQCEERGYSLTPLLETLDTVARGQRLSIVFSRHHKYYGRADLVFVKEHLRNANLLHEFANCLPAFVSVTNRGESMKFMKDLVSEDGLWTSLQGHLWTALREDSPIPDKSRIFVACCTVLDQAFVALEDSKNVDWRTPEFGLLGRHFETFVAQGFQGTFIGRATNFRIGIIRVRFCRALLAQFSRELDRNATVDFRSQWDVAPLARLFYILGIARENDAEFCKSFVDGGHVGTEFMTKAYEMLKIAVRDGPLLTFCKLGRLATTMVPFEGSDLNDLETLLKLLQNMMDDSRLPLNSASSEVWEDLRQLRDDVSHVISKSYDEDKDNMWPLFEKIDQVYHLRPFTSQESGPSNYLLAPSSKTWALLGPQLSRERSLRNRYSDASGSSSTVVAESRYTASPTKENDFRETAMDAHLDSPRGPHNKHVTHYCASDPYHTSDIGSGGVIAGPSVATAYIPPPLQGNVPLAPQDISPVHPPFLYTRQDIQYPVVSVDIYPEQNTVGNSDNRSPRTPLTPRSPRPACLDPASAGTASLSSHSNAVD